MVKYYCLLGIDRSRKPFLLDQFDRYGLDKVEFLEDNNVDSLTDSLIEEIYDSKNEIEIRNSKGKCSRIYPNYWYKLTKGQITCTYKHYLAIRKFLLETDEPYCIIMEDNISFKSNVTPLVSKILDEMGEIGGDSVWDMVFDSDICEIKYVGKTIPNKITYKIMSEGKNVALVSNHGDGGTKGANFYLLYRRSAKLLYDNFLPFTTVVDFYYNYLIRKLNLNVFWVHPGNVHKINRPSTCTPNE